MLLVAGSQKTGQITQLAEPVVKFAGESAVLPCTVSFPPGVTDIIVSMIGIEKCKVL